MDGKPKHYQTIDGYIQIFPKEVQERLETIRQLIRRLAPDAKERISYQMPTFVLNGNLIHFAAFKNHIGLYPMPDGIKAFQTDLSKYKNAKGSVQFPLSEPLPIKLIERIVKYRIQRDKERAKKPKRPLKRTETNKQSK